MKTRSTTIEKTPDKNGIQRAEIYQQIHKDYLDRYNSTRQIEWIVNGALWAGIVIVGGQIAGHVDLYHKFTGWEVVVLGVIGGLLHYALWMYPIQSSENADNNMIEKYLKLTHLALRGSDLENQTESKKLSQELFRFDTSIYKRFCKWFLKGILDRFDWAVIESIITAVLIWIVLTFLNNNIWTLK